MTETHTETDYIFDTGSDLGHEHMTYLESVLDAPTIGVLEHIDVQPGQRCLDIGAGGGAITRWLADRVGPTGAVVAVDLDTEHLVARPGIEIHRHDINDGLPVEGPYDVIHARATLVHLPRRLEIFAFLVDALAPGGWIVLGDPSDYPRTALAAPTEEDFDLWSRIQSLSHDVVAPTAGMDLRWASELDRRMAAAGLVNIHGVEYSETTDGGTPGALLHGNLNAQAEPLLLEAGATRAELDRYRELTRDPRFRAWFYRFVCTRGQKPRV